MLRSNRVLAVLLGSLAMGSLGCSLSIDQIFAMQEGSGLDVCVSGRLYGASCRKGASPFDGGTVMRIHVSTTLLDYLDGTVDGDVELLDLLFAIPGFQFFIFADRPDLRRARRSAGRRHVHLRRARAKRPRSTWSSIRRR